ncbi:hypothetical protein [Flavobacterium urocaniciphilum]|uniref:Uncharacterized protein n=1 Tax=Flavobacterium urocaniciphilum TaxID=1299341 RepID=A0A1H8Z3L8_9FLAO|nr:hypothetical protein [Flavobacterium urocaniciphilum]SEP58198.1 hypothetical protein SAMN05444005_101423 [Flavobacterium urocaniciphilum]
MKKIILVFSFLFLAFCTKKENLKIENKTADSLNENVKPIAVQPKFENVFKNHLYIVGPHLDLNGNLELGCDCCSSQFYFCDSIHFIEVAYCLEANDLLIGEYSVNEKGLQLKYNKNRLLMEFDFENDTDSLAVQKPIYSEITNKEFKTIWTKHKNTRFYDTSDEEVSEQRDSLKTSFIKTIKEDEVVSKFLRKNNIKI